MHACVGATCFCLHLSENQQDPPFLTQINSGPPSLSKELRMTRIKVSIRPKILTRETLESIL